MDRNQKNLCTENKTVSYLRENSAPCEFFDMDPETITKDRLYTSSLDLYSIHECLEDYLHQCVCDMFYMNRKNRRILKLLKIEAGGKPPGRPSKEQLTEEYREKMARNVGERNEVEATFGTGKRVYRANNIRAKLAATGESWTGACYFTKNVMKFPKGLLRALILMGRWMEKLMAGPDQIGKQNRMCAICQISVHFRKL